MSKTNTSAEDRETKAFVDALTNALDEFNKGIEVLRNESTDTLTYMMTKLRSRDDLPSDDPGYIDFHNLVTGVLNTLIAIILDDRDVKTNVINGCGRYSEKRNKRYEHNGTHRKN